MRASVVLSILRDRARDHVAPMLVCLLMYAGHGAVDPYRSRIEATRLYRFATLFASPFLVSSLVSLPLQALVRDLLKAVQMLAGLLLGRPVAAGNTAEVQYHRLVGDVGARAREPFFSRELAGLANSVEELRGRTTEHDRVFGSVIAAVRKALELPTAPHRIAPTDQLRRRVDEVVAGHPERLQRVAREMAFHTCRNSRVEHEPVRQVVSLYGPPGTGKTTFARRYAEALGLPLIEISLAGIKNVSELVGHRCGQAHLVNNRPALLTQLLADAPCNNAVLFFDECTVDLNPALQQFLLQFADKTQPTLHVAELAYDLDVSRFLVMFAGNARFESAAINNRLDWVEFGPVARELRTRVARERADELLAGLGPDDAAVEALIEADDDPGLRTLLSGLERLANHQRAALNGWADHAFDPAPPRPPPPPPALLPA